MFARALTRQLVRSNFTSASRLAPVTIAATTPFHNSIRSYAERVSPSPQRLARQQAAADIDSVSAEGPTTTTPPQDPFDVLNDAPHPGRGSGEKEPPKSAYISSTDRKRTARFRYSGYLALLGLVGGVLHLGRALDEEERAAHPTISDDWKDYFARVNARRSDVLAFYNEPPFAKLLPDMLPEYGRPYTLVIALEDLMVHSAWDREHGWRIAKRPGLDYFLAYLFQYYEIIVFTNQPDATAAPIIQKVDQQPGYIMYPLFRAHTRYVDGKYVKDLNYLNRDLKKVIMLETDPDAWSANPDNTVKLPSWKGDKSDKDLVALIPFLEYVAALGVDDVRAVIRDYDGTHIPTEFARREEQLRTELRKEIGTKKKRPGPPAWLLTALGMKPTEQKGDGDIKTFMDLARERGQQQYMEMQRHLEAHKDDMIQEQKNAEKEMAEQMKTSLNKIFTEGFPKQQ